MAGAAGSAIYTRPKTGFFSKRIIPSLSIKSINRSDGFVNVINYFNLLTGFQPSSAVWRTGAGFLVHFQVSLYQIAVAIAIFTLFLTI
jgi:hypothetical protein